MNSKQRLNASAKFVEYLNKEGTTNERNLDVNYKESRYHSDAYKPFYRSAAIFIHAGAYRSEMLGGEIISREDAEEILRDAHPFFVIALDGDRRTWEHLWKFHADVRMDVWITDEY